MRRVRVWPRYRTFGRVYVLPSIRWHGLRMSPRHQRLARHTAARQRASVQQTELFNAIPTNALTGHFLS